ncbi:MAG TPA: hypothetical protein VK470_11865, partial [Bacteroidota bacterium]|nr:hypothetical protein [Bacteroidota bacterium]
MKREFLMLCMFCVIAAGCKSSHETQTDCYSVARYKKMMQPAYDLYIMSVRAGLETRVDLYVQMQYDRLRFQKSEKGYSASYTVVFVIRGDDGEPVQSHDVSRTIDVATYEETISLSADAFLQSFTLSPGTYELECSSTDQNSLVRYTKKSELSVCNFATECKAASTVLLLMKPKNEEKGIVLRPLFPQTLWYARDSIGVFQELYNIHGQDTIIADFRYMKQSYELGKAGMANVTMSPPYIQMVAVPPRRLDSLVYKSRTVRTAGVEGTLPFVNYYPMPPLGFTVMELRIRMFNGERKDSAVSVIRLFRRRSLHPDSDEIVEAMRFILRREEFDSLRSAAVAEREQLLNQFWNVHGGAQRRSDFETRIDEADKLF